MPARGKYFFSESDDCRITDPLYEKYRYTSQQLPLLLLLLFIAIIFWTTLIIIFFVKDVSIDQYSFSKVQGYCMQRKDAA